jgi:hypothetical protein
MNFFLWGLFFVFGFSAAAERQVLLGAIPEREELREYDTFLGQAPSPTLITIPSSQEERGALRQPSHLNEWCSQEASCCCCPRPCSRKTWSYCGLSVIVFTGITTLCLWKLKTYGPSCAPDDC